MTAPTSMVTASQKVVGPGSWESFLEKRHQRCWAEMNSQLNLRSSSQSWTTSRRSEGCQPPNVPKSFMTGRDNTLGLAIHANKITTPCSTMAIRSSSARTCPRSFTQSARNALKKQLGYYGHYVRFSRRSSSQMHEEHQNKISTDTEGLVLTLSVLQGP